MVALSWAQHSRPILLALALATFNQLSGINAILYYLNDIFAAAGFTGLSGDLQSVAIGATNLIATLVGMAFCHSRERLPSRSLRRRSSISRSKFSLLVS